MHLLEVAAAPGQALQKLTRLHLLCCPRQAYCQSQQLLLAAHCPLMASHCLLQQQRQVQRAQAQCLSPALDCSLSLQERSRQAMRRPDPVQRCRLRAWKAMRLCVAVALLRLV